MPRHRKLENVDVVAFEHVLENRAVVHVLRRQWNQRLNALVIFLNDVDFPLVFERKAEGKRDAPDRREVPIHRPETFGITRDVVEQDRRRITSALLGEHVRDRAHLGVPVRTVHAHQLAHALDAFDPASQIAVVCVRLRGALVTVHQPSCIASNFCYYSQRLHRRISAGQRRRRSRVPNPDLRDWLAKMQAAGEIQTVRGAETTEEIGGLVDLYMRQTNRPALLFEDIPGYPKGYRVIGNILTGVKRIALTFGLPEDTTEMGLVHFWRKYLNEAKSIPPKVVETGPLMENVATGKKINLRKIPTPKWHEDDGGPYIGTGVMVVMKDPDSGWINYGAYRVQVYDDPTIASVMISKGKHGDILMRKYH
jgi:hypothetical protein